MPIDPYYGFYGGASSSSKKSSSSGSGGSYQTISVPIITGGYSMPATPHTDTIKTPTQKQEITLPTITVTSAPAPKEEVKKPVPAPTPQPKSMTSYEQAKQAELSGSVGFGLTEKIPTREQAAAGGPLVSFGLGTVRGGAGVLDLVGETTRNPGRALNIFLSGWNPSALYTSAVSNPPAFAGEFIGSVALLKPFGGKLKVSEAAPGKVRIVENVKVDVLRKTSTPSFVDIEVLKMPEYGTEANIIYERTASGYTQVGTGRVEIVGPIREIGRNARTTKPNIVETKNPFLGPGSITEIRKPAPGIFTVKENVPEPPKPNLRYSLEPKETVFDVTKRPGDFLNVKIPPERDLFIQEMTKPSGQGPAAISKTPFSATFGGASSQVQFTRSKLYGGLGERVLSSPRPPQEAPVFPVTMQRESQRIVNEESQFISYPFMRDSAIIFPNNTIFPSVTRQKERPATIISPGFRAYEKQNPKNKFAPALIIGPKFTEKISGPNKVSQFTEDLTRIKQKQFPAQTPKVQEKQFYPQFPRQNVRLGWPKLVIKPPKMPRFPSVRPSFNFKSSGYDRKIAPVFKGQGKKGILAPFASIPNIIRAEPGAFKEGKKIRSPSEKRSRGYFFKSPFSESIPIARLR